MQIFQPEGKLPLSSCILCDICGHIVFQAMVQSDEFDLFVKLFCKYGDSQAIRQCSDQLQVCCSQGQGSTAPAMATFLLLCRALKKPTEQVAQDPIKPSTSQSKGTSHNGYLSRQYDSTPPCHILLFPFTYKKFKQHEFSPLPKRLFHTRLKAYCSLLLCHMQEFKSLAGPRGGGAEEGCWLHQGAQVREAKLLSSF